MSYESARIRGVAGYAYGEQPADPAVLKLNTNENAYPPAPAVGRALATFDAAELRRYPPATADPLRRQVAELLGLDASQVVATNGGDEGLRLAMATFVDAGDVVGLATPSYSLYPVQAKVQGAEVAELPLAADWLPGSDFGARLQAAGTKLVCLANPHAPSGALWPAAAVAALARELDGVLLVDEAYVDFVDPALGHALVPLLAEHDNLLLLRTFSKGYALAGMRVGLLLGSPALTEPIRTKTRDSFNVDAIAQRLASAALAEQGYAEERWRRTRVERDRLAGALRGLGFGVCDSQANFVLAEAPAGVCAATLQRQLRERKVLVRHFNTPRLANCLRITVGTATQVDALLAALAATLPAAETGAPVGAKAAGPQCELEGAV